MVKIDFRVCVPSHVHKVKGFSHGREVRGRRGGCRVDIDRGRLVGCGTFGLDLQPSGSRKHPRLHPNLREDIVLYGNGLDAQGFVQDAIYKSDARRNLNFIRPRVADVPA